MKFIRLTNNIGKYFLIYKEQYGNKALLAYLKGYIKGLRKVIKNEIQY